MVDALNAEVALGTIANVREAISWIGYTYLFGELVHAHGKADKQYACAANHSFMVRFQVDLTLISL